MKKFTITALKVILLTVIMFISMAVSSLLVGVQNDSRTSGSSIALVLIYCILNTLILTLFIVKSRLRGLKLAAVCSIVFWGIQYFMTQIETLYFNSAVKMPIIEIVKVVASGAIYAVIFSLLAVLILGKFKKEAGSSNNHDGKIKMPFADFIRNIVVLSIAYVIIYFVFGYFVAWQFADLRYYYTKSTEIVNIFQQISNQFRQDPVIFLFQLFRGFLWSALAIIIIRSLDSTNWMAYIITGLIFSILITTPLIFPNAYMPLPVRLGHSFELSTSMLVFGFLSIVAFKNYSVRLNK